MIIEYEHFKEHLNAKLFENSYSKLLEKLTDNPDRYIGLFRPTKPKTKLIQNITQSHEIRFGDALELLFEKYFEALGLTILPKKIISENRKEYNIDQLFEKDEKIYLIEQKVRDDHDSTKKAGQFNNFESKYHEVSQKYPNKTIIPIMWFIDKSLRKNRNFYLQEIEKMRDDYACDAFLFYGEELFKEKEGIQDFDIKIWEEVLQHLTQWKESLPDMPEINFDLNATKVFQEIKDLSPSVFRTLLNNEEIVKQIFPIIFPTGETLNLLADYFDNKETQIYKTLSNRIRKLPPQLSIS